MSLPPKELPDYQHWLKHKDTYGPISSVLVMDRTLILIHDREVAYDLLQKKSMKTSSRPQTEFGHKLCGFDKILVMQDYDDRYRCHRKMIHQHLGSRAAMAQYNDILEVEARRFLLRVLKEPENLIKHVRAEAGAVILGVTYGYSIGANTADPLVDFIERIVSNISASAVPMNWLVDIFPAMKYLPDGFPGTSFKETARQWSAITQRAADVPYSFVRQQIKRGNHRQSYVSRILEERKNNRDGITLGRDDEDAIKWTAATLYIAGSDTMVSSLSSFILAMVLFPDVQRRAQDEIDCVVGSSRLPRLQDRDKLPYIKALVKEVFRWLPPGPMGIAHMSEEDSISNGYLIPKGAILLPAIWWFCHNPEFHLNPSSFDPERYMEPRNESDPATIVFRFGRRVCPGQYLAEYNLFITIAQTLAAFNIGRAVDSQGVEIEAYLKVTPTLVAHPKEFPYRIEPRSFRHAELVRNIEVEEPCVQSDDSGLLSELWN
ncbi:hypothetical protein HIM_12592 [Hirsutella minnesotensis 3608]|uniref:O-methylsterigmatocystin oxidoreductase n=1 Tax=Hirsutella minnesotensis 3608 TaxID=1043627 RepID=A0A0F7ZVY2_9HYPO|nr:hypothetical protein HIM_12592 [Hirsutella minnesotensis 3608]